MGSPPINLEARFDRIEAILEIKHRLAVFCRGADRIDEDLMWLAFHPGALCDYGAYKAQVEDYIPWVADAHRREFISTLHSLSNIVIEIDGDKAFSEAVLQGRLRYAGADGLYDTSVVSRYIDTWEKRDAGWKIVFRQVLNDSYGTEKVGFEPDGLRWVTGLSKGSRDRNDASYLTLGRLSD